MEPRDREPFHIAEEDALRAQCYALLGRLLASPPPQDLLTSVSRLQGDKTALGQAFSALASVAQATTPDAVAHEYQELFIGLGRGELVPYGSFYLTGFLYEKPLADLRSELARLGVAAAEGVAEPEDHIAILCETMAGLITGAFGEPLSLAEQRRFFDAHVGCWAPRFFRDLEAARAAAFYMPVGRLGRLLMEVEAAAFAMAA